MLFWRAGRSGLRAAFAAVRAREIPWWYLAGGAGGALFVLSQGLTGAVVGVALFTVAIVSGQTVSGLVLDARGLGTVGRRRITVTRIVGSALAIVAVGWAVSSQLFGSVAWWVLALPFIAGLAISVQQAVNGQVRQVAGSAMTATFMNFLVGATLLVMAAVVHSLVAGLPASLPAQPWFYLGGLIGVCFIGLSVVVVKTTGVLLLGLGSVGGQLTTALLFDLLLPVPGHNVVWTTVAGTALTLVAVVIAALPSRAASSRA
jgi:transporter family-2 protein